MVHRLGWVTDGVMAFLSKTVVNVALPCSMFATFLGDFSRPQLLDLFPLVPIPFVAIVLSLAVARIVAQLFVPVGRPAGVPYALVVYMATTLLYWTVGSALIASDGPRVPHDSWVHETGSIVKRLVLSPPIVALALSVVLVLAEVKAPAVLLEATRSIGNLTTPLSMMFVGISVAQSNLKQLRLDRSTVLVTLGRFLLTPALLIGCLSLARAIGVAPPKVAVAAFFVQATMPTMAQTAILARSTGSDHEFAARITVLTTLLSLIVIPVVFAVLQTVVL